MEELELGVGALVGFHVEGVNLSFIFPSFLDKNKGDLEDGDNENKKKKQNIFMVMEEVERWRMMFCSVAGMEWEWHLPIDVLRDR